MALGMDGKVSEGGSSDILEATILLFVWRDKDKKRLSVWTHVTRIKLKEILYKIYAKFLLHYAVRHT
jgi:hypothetical protein